MDVFGVRDRLIEDYREFTGSFVDIHDRAIREHVQERMERGYQLPDPWLSLNPSFASGGTISEIVGQGYRPVCGRKFSMQIRTLPAANSQLGALPDRSGAET